MTNIVGCAADEVAIGMPVQVEFREQGEAYVPVFRPTKAPPSGAADKSL
jgi:uncharacterized OB-fold protein